MIIGEGLRREDWAEGGGRCATLNGQGGRGLGPSGNRVESSCKGTATRDSADDKSIISVILSK